SRMSGDEADPVDTRRSARRRGNARKDTQLSALEKLKEARKSGKTHKAEDNTVANVYDEVDEDEYNDIVRQRQKDDFVIDDDGAGYVDHGADFDDEDEEDFGEKRKRQKKDKENKPKKGAISSFFAAANSMTKTKAKDDNDIKLEDMEDLDEMLAAVDEDMATPERRNPCRLPQAAAPSPDRAADRIVPKVVPRPSAVHHSATPAPKPSRPAVAAASTTPAARSAPVKRPAAVSVSPPPIAEKKKKEVEQSYSDDDLAADLGMDLDEITANFKDEEMEETKPEPVLPARREKKEIKVEKEEIKEKAAPMVFDDWNEEKKEECSSESAASEQGSEAFYLESEDGKKTLRVFWMDAYEDDRKHPGVVYLFGRVFTRPGVSSSICIVVKNIRRQIFLLPKQTEDGIPWVEVYNEVKDLLMNKHGVMETKCKQGKRKFINDGTVPEAAEPVDVMEVQYYESKSARLAPAHEGATFSRVYNTTTTSMERLLVECRLKGPGWINVANYVAAPSRVSWCTYEFVVDMSDDLPGGTEKRPQNIVFDMATMDPPPPIRMMCLNVVTGLNAKKEPEILALSYLINGKASIENPTTDTRAFRRMAFLCPPPTGVALPFDLKKRLGEARLTEDMVKVVANEKALLVAFISSLTNEQIGEPDCFVGHDLQATMALLMAKCEKYKIMSWSRLSRLRRSHAPKQLGQSKAAQWEATAGRLMLDSRAAAMELVHSRNYDLTELCKTLLGQNRNELHPHEVVGKYYGSSSKVIELLNEAWLECYRPLCILAQIQALPLFRGITNICGGVMSRTLLGGRAERNELLLLHAFHKAGLVAPDKYQHVFAVKGKGKKEAQSQGEEEGDEKGGAAAAAAPKGGAQYSGGLVLEPKKGLYDTLVLLLDFNSLYPSIIQQFNICFTTIRHDKNGDELPEEPKGATTRGILPTEIESLVTQRYSVKNLMANERNPEKKKQYDIRQKALKLTANSMYGCLGFAQSRFYAKPLAALVTAKGREILMQTKTSVEKLNYEVIYGDTDSIMVNTGDLNMERAAKIAKEITKMVNERHRKIELEHEGTFRRMLLLKKKKYAALIMLDNNGKTKQELKGLDIVRRDWSMLAKKIGSSVVDVMLNPALSREELVDQINTLLTRLKEDLDEGVIGLDMFSIFKSLTRDPSKYENVQQQPHAAVARRMNESGQKSYKQGDIVEYAICVDGTTASATQRAYHKQEMQTREDLKIDFQYYLAQQVHPVVSRLCAPIDELDGARIAELLGLDASQYRSKASAADDNGPAWQENYDNCEGIKITCPACEHVNELRTVFCGEGMNRRSSLDCCEKCEVPFHAHDAAVYNQFDRQCQSLVEQQQTAAYVCEDVVCAHKMRSMPMRVTRDGLECPKCRTSFMHKEYTAKTLFDQQTYFDSILDLGKAVTAIKNKDVKTTITFRPGHRQVTDLAIALKRLNDTFMARNSYNIVDLSFVFGPMMSK
ncbi:hypothetical protein PENTCL1PPCAC_20101, partial [Pristionchus entomophagus]